MTQPKSQIPQTASKPTIPERLLKAKSLLNTSRMACLHISDQSDTDFFDISETLEFVEALVEQCAEELETKRGGG